MESKHIVGYIMTGGKNRRMNGQIKLFLKMDGSTFFERIYDAVSSFEEVYLSVNQKEPYEELGLPMVQDEIEEIGPMGGLLSGFHQIDADALFVVASDMPFLTREAVEEMKKLYTQYGTCIIARSAGDQRIHPLCGIYPRSILCQLEGMVSDQNYRMMRLLSSVEIHFYEVSDDQDILANVNSPEELKRYI